MRQGWLASELRAAGLDVVEINGWRDRGGETFNPVGVQWHATAGSRTSTASGEVNTLLNGSTSAPPPIAQLLIHRDGVVYVVAAGRCNHNKVGWAGLNKGLGNVDLFGIEMSNDNRGEPWPLKQLDAARLATAVIMRKIGADPMRRLTGHYEHQPWPAPPGETSTKSDPYGVAMSTQRPRVATLMEELNVLAITDPDLEKIEQAAKRGAEAAAPVIARKTMGFDPGDANDDGVHDWPGIADPWNPGETIALGTAVTTLMERQSAAAAAAGEQGQQIEGLQRAVADLTAMVRLLLPAPVDPGTPPA